MNLYELREASPDALNAARGIVFGFAFSAAVWAVLVTIYMYVFK